MANNENQVREIIDRAQTLAFQRGRKKPGWEEAWQALAENPTYGRVLAERGVRVSGLIRDLEYAARFGMKDGVAPDEFGNREILRRAARDIERRIAKLVAGKDGFYGERPSPADQMALEKRALEITVISDFRQQMEEITGGLLDEHDPAYAKVYGYLIESLLRRYLDDKLGADAYRLDENALLFFSEILRGPLFNDEDFEALSALKQFAARQEDPSPVEVIESLQSVMPDYYNQLLFHNGMLSDDAALEDELADHFPAAIVQDVALEAVQAAYRLGSRVVDARHVALALIRRPETQRHLHDLGIKDLLAFADEFVERAFAAERKANSETAIRVHPKITDDFRALIADLDGFCAAKEDSGHLPSLMLRKIFRENEIVDEALNKAGLLRRMSRGWAAPYKDGAAKKDKDGEDDDAAARRRKEKVFEVSDAQLEALIAEYCVDYTKLASQKKFDPMIGNEDAMAQVETTLLKRGKKNPIVIGEAGIGKTKILEGFAQRIVSGKVPKPLIGSRLLSLDLHSINTSPFVGVFESRILPILKGVAERNASGRFPPIQLAIDEFANAMDAGAHSKGEGIRGMIKPYLTSGDLFVIATTTLEEYQTKVQKDPALSRRFNPVSMRPPTEAEAAQILMQLKPRFARDHDIRIPNALIARVANLAERYIHQVNHPDKTLDLLDLACAMAVRAGEKTLEDRHIVKAASSMSGVPEEFLSRADNKRYAALPAVLKGMVLDQEEAVDSVAASLQRAKAGLRSNPEAPVGTFLFVGPTGVGKTELTRALAKYLFGSEDFLTRFDMAEFQEKQSAARFIGAPPGYVGYEEGGGLVKAVRAKPYSVILYDEIEKAHPDVFNVLLRPFDSGMMTDGRGLKANMRNTVNIMTSNIGAAEVMARGRQLGLDPLKDPEKWQEMARPIYQKAVEDFFRPEFLNRLDGVIYFNSLGPQTIGLLVDRQIAQAQRQVSDNYGGLALELSPVFRQAVAAQGFDVRYGARPLKRAFQDMVATPMAQWLLTQDERRLKRASKIVVTSDESAGDPEALVAKALDAAQPGEDIMEIYRQARMRAEDAAAIRPVFRLEK